MISRYLNILAEKENTKSEYRVTFLGQFIFALKAH